MSEPTLLGIFVTVGDDLESKLAFAADLGIGSCHLGIHSSLVQDTPPVDRLREALQRFRIAPTVVFCLFAGEDYSDIPTVRRTVGLVPEATRMRRLEDARRIAELAVQLDAPAVGLHLGFLPPRGRSAQYRDMLDATGQLAEHCRQLGLRLHLETGQEPAEQLLRFVEDLEKPNVAVNFDPANFVLYGTDDPVAAARTLAAHVRSLHAKDALPSPRPGIDWGTEVPLGEGSVDFATLIRIFRAAGYNGPLTIEREITGPEQQRDIARGAQFLRELLGRLQAEGTAE